MVVMMVPVTLMVVMICVVMMSVMMMPFDFAQGRRNAWIFAEHKRFDRDGHGERGHSNAAEIDEVEVPERDAIERQHLRGHTQLL